MKLLLLSVGLMLTVAAAPHASDDDHEFSEETNEPNSEGERISRVQPGTQVPEAINWVERGAVTAVKDQGQCGSCYAFSAVGALEGLLFKNNQTVTDLSPQELVDCSAEEGNEGCSGGWMSNCFEYVRNRPGIDDLESYPYTGEDFFKCSAAKGQVAAYCEGHVKVRRGDEEALRRAVGTAGPVSACFAVHRAFLGYTGGVYDGACAPTINHAILIVGYGTDNETSTDYWLVKNSWGPEWGEKGYFRLVRNKNKCGIADKVSYPVL